jgi:hypothetical protein
MSKVMLHGVLNMPTEMWHKDLPIDDIQRQARYVEASKLILKQDDMIAELKKRLSHAEAMGDKEQSVRDLEQQALACDWIYTKLPNYSSENLSVITARRLELVTQANALRSKSERP